MRETGGRTAASLNAAHFGDGGIQIYSGRAVMTTIHATMYDRYWPWSIRRDVACVLTRQNALIFPPA